MGEYPQYISPMGATDHRRDLIPHCGHRAGISSVSFRRRSRVKPGMRFFLFFSLYRQRGRTKRELVARSGSDKITIHRSLCNSVTTRHSSSKLDSALAAPSFHSFAAGLASLKQVLAMPSAPCSIIGFYTFPSRYRNVIRSKDEDYPSLLSAISSRKATGRRTQFGNLGKVQASLPLLSLLLSFRPPSRNLIRVIRSRLRIKSAMRGLGGLCSVAPKGFIELNALLSRGLTHPAYAVSP